jgi:PAS domain-containing protein
VNPAFERHTGIPDAEGRRMRDVVPDHEEHWFKHYGDIALTGEPQRFEAPASQLGDRWYDLNAFRVGEPEQRRVAIVFTDITQRRRDAAKLRDREERLRRLNEQLEARVRERTSDAADVDAGDCSGPDR